jgi:hypothetical protein
VIEPERIKNIKEHINLAGLKPVRNWTNQKERRSMRQHELTSSESFAAAEATPGYATDLKTVEVATSLLTASGRLKKYGEEAGAGINAETIFDVRQSLIGMFLIVNKLKSFSENLSATAMIHQQAIFALELSRDWPEDEDLRAVRSELRKMADGLAFVTGMETQATFKPE